MAQTVKKLSLQCGEAGFRSTDQEDPSLDLLYSCLENPMDKGWAHGAARSDMAEQLTLH